SFQDELLHAFAFEIFPRVDVAFRVDGDAADAVERARIASAVAEAADDFEGVAARDEDLLIVSVGNIEVALLRIARKGDVPDRAGPLRLRRHRPLFQEFAGLVERFDAVVAAIADVDLAVLRDFHAGDAGERGVRSGAGPLALVVAGRGV